MSEFFRSLGLLTAFTVSFNNSASLSYFIATHARWTGARPGIISFIFIFIVILVIFKALAVAARIFLRSESGDISTLSKLAALTLSLGRGLLIVSLVYSLFINSPFEYLSRSARDRSFSGRYVSGIATSVYKRSVNFYPGGESELSLGRLLKKD